MTAIFNNFVAIRKERGDVLNPAQYRSIVEAIKTVLVKYDFTGFNQSYRLFLDHLTQFNDPHHDRDINFLNDIIAGVYDVYTEMTATPLSFSDFKNQTATSLDFLELIRRIVINRDVYDQVKLYDATVPASFSAYLTEDWGVNPASLTPSLLYYPRALYNETDFINAGWNGNTKPFSAIATANNLSTSNVDLPIIFTTSGVVDCLIGTDFGNGYVIPISVASNDFTIDLQVIGTITQTTTVFSLTNGSDDIDIVIGQDQTVSVVVNEVSVLTNPNASTDGKINVVLTKAGIVSITTRLGLDQIRTIGSFVLTLTSPCVNGLIELPIDDFISTSLRLRYLTIYYGSGQSSIVPLDPTPVIPVLPSNYVFLTDDDGSYLMDDDGAYLIDSGTTSSTNSSLPIVASGYALLVDSDGTYLLDTDGAYLIVSVDTTQPSSTLPTVPTGYALVIDTDGSYVVDDDGAYVIASS